MIGVIPNPKKSFQIEKPVEELKQALADIWLYTSKYIRFKENPMLGLYTYEASEFLSLGVYIDLSASSVNDTKSEVTIEIRRKVGSFDKSHEVSLAHTHINAFTDLITQSLNAGPETRDNKKAEINKKVAEQKQANLEKRQAILLKEKEEKENSPLLFYAKRTGSILLIIACFIIAWFIILKGCQSL